MLLYHVTFIIAPNRNIALEILLHSHSGDLVNEAHARFGGRVHAHRGFHVSSFYCQPVSPSIQPPTLLCWDSLGRDRSTLMKYMLTHIIIILATDNTTTMYFSTTRSSLPLSQPRLRPVYICEGLLGRCHRPREGSGEQRWQQQWERVGDGGCGCPGVARIVAPARPYHRHDTCTVERRPILRTLKSWPCL